MESDTQDGVVGSLACTITVNRAIPYMLNHINLIPKGDPKRKQLLDSIAEKTVALGLLQDELRTLTK